MDLNSKEEDLNIPTIDYTNDREVLIKKQNEIIEQLKKSIARKSLEITEQNKVIQAQKKIDNQYNSLMEHIKILSDIKTIKYPIKKIQNYKKMLKLFYSFKYTKKRKKKVFIFANCHGNIYKDILSNIDKHNILDIEHILSYENLDKYDNIKHKFSECDILIIQPIQNYEKWKIENLLPLSKKDCMVIRIPFIRFNGYWDKNDVRDLNKFKQPAVMFFPNIKEETKVSKYLDGNLLNENKITANFKSAVEELKNLENQGDIKFVDFIMKNHQSIPLFRDAYHPTQTMYDFISYQLVEAVHKKIPSLSKINFSIPENWEKEYGYFKPIDNTTAKILGLGYDLDSYFKYSRSTYLKAILHHENRIYSHTINDLSNLTKVLNDFDDTKVDYSKILNHFNNCIAYDAEWQFPAITEQHAFHMFRNNNIVYDNKAIYIAFPWATLIDLLDRKNNRSHVFLDALTQIKKETAGKKHIITVCQHINMLKYQDIFEEMGITDIFWTHAIKDQYSFPKLKNIQIHPFPLYPVQVKDIYNQNIERIHLYSFVGARSSKYYLTQTRNFIIDILANDNRGLIIAREEWHYNNIVYNHQIKKEVDSNSQLIDNTASTEFQDIVKKSIFSLCPSGSGPNSIRLWESIGFGTIPVILSDTYLPPGNLDLWNEAVIYCDETEEAIQALPNHLKQLSKDPELLASKRHAMAQLWMLYGPDCFIYDIQKLLLNYSEQSSLQEKER